MMFSCSYFETVKAINDKADNCTCVSIAIFTVNWLVLFCKRMKITSIKKINTMQMFFRLQSEDEVFSFAIENFSYEITDREPRFI